MERAGYGAAETLAEVDWADEGAAKDLTVTTSDADTLRRQADLQERQRSLQRPGGFANPDWIAFREHPLAGKMTAAVLLGTWVACDHPDIR
jgi:hypothetical protein